MSLIPGQPTPAASVAFGWLTYGGLIPIACRARVSSWEPRNHVNRSTVEQMNNVALTLASAIVFFGALPNGLCQSDDESKRFVEFFIGNCLQVLPDTKRVQAASRAMKWKVLQRDLAVMLAPADPEATWEGWAAKYEGSSYFIGISQGEMDGRTVVGCTVATREVNQEELIKTLLRACCRIADRAANSQYIVSCLAINLPHFVQ